MDWSYVKLGWSCWQKVLLFTPRVLHSACLVQNKVFFMSREAAAGDFTTFPTLGLSPKDVPGEQGHSAGCIPRKKKKALFETTDRIRHSSKVLLNLHHPSLKHPNPGRDA